MVSYAMVHISHWISINCLRTLVYTALCLDDVALPILRWLIFIACHSVVDIMEAMAFVSLAMAKGMLFKATLAFVSFPSKYNQTYIR